MLRDIKTRHIQCRIYAGEVQTTATSAVLGNDNFSSVVSASGISTITYKQPYARGSLALSTPAESLDLFALVRANAITPLNSAVLRLVNGAGSFADGSADFLSLGYRATGISRANPQTLLGCYRNSRIVTGRIKGSDGSIEKGISDLSCVRNGTGDYTITFKRAFSQSPTTLFSAINGATCVRALRSTKSASSVRVKFGGAGPAAVDPTSFYIFAYGTDMRDAHGLAFAPVQNSQRKPRLVCGQITVSGGTPTLNINSNEFSSITDNGVGDFTLNLAEAFRQECTIIGLGVGGSVQVHTGSASAPRIICHDQSGAASDLTSIDFVILGSDDPSEY